MVLKSHVDSIQLNFLAVLLKQIWYQPTHNFKRIEWRKSGKKLIEIKWHCNYNVSKFFCNIFAVLL